MRVTQKSRRLKALIGATTAAVAALPVFVGAGVASASTPGATDAANVQASARANGGTKLVSATSTGSNKLRLVVRSESMNRDIPLDVIRPADTSKAAPRCTCSTAQAAARTRRRGRSRPTSAPSSRVSTSTWSPRCRARSPTTPTGRRPTTPCTCHKWETFLTQELPPVIDSALGTTKVNSLAGISTSGTSVFNLALKDPQLYKAVGAYSGCADTVTPMGQTYIQIVIAARGSAEVENMWGPVGSPDWQAHDPIYNIGKLKGGPKLYVANASGLPGPHDTLESQGINGNVSTLANQIIVGGIIEAATNECTHRLFDAVNFNGMGDQAHFDFKPSGTHSWGYWRDDPGQSWPMLAESMGTA